MSTPTPDTSPKNIAQELRFLANYLPNIGAAYNRAHALADALDQQAAAPTWEQRVRKANDAMHKALPLGEWDIHSVYDGLTASLKAAFPEYAPSDDGEG